MVKSAKLGYAGKERGQYEDKVKSGEYLGWGIRESWGRQWLARLYSEDNTKTRSPENCGESDLRGEGRKKRYIIEGTRSNV